MKGVFFFLILRGEKSRKERREKLVRLRVWFFELNFLISFILIMFEVEFRGYRGVVFVNVFSR